MDEEEVGDGRCGSGVDLRTRGRGSARDGGEHHEAVEARTNAERNRALVEEFEGAEGDDAERRLMLLGSGGT
jgi:hypothetical protein